MKRKKILTMISAAVMAATLGATSLAGCNSNKHVHAYNWTTDYEATCTLPGQKTGKCVCGDVKAEVIPVVPDAHEFDSDWTIDDYPNDIKTGKATRTCKNNNAHKFEAILPKLTEENKYLSVEVTKKPTIISEGKCHYILEHSAGEVEFDIAIAKHEEVEGIEDVVDLASSLHGEIRKSEGSYIYGDPAGSNVHTNTFTNYYGDNYTRVHDGGNRRDFWYSLDEKGEPFGISAEVQRVIINEPDDPENPPEGWVAEFGEVASDPRIDESVIKEDLLGLSYESGGGMPATYGAEDTLKTYYEASQSSGAIKFDSGYTEEDDGGYTGWFEFSRMEQPNFCRYRIDFKTFPNGAIYTLSVRTKIIRAFMLANTFNGSNYRDAELIFDSDGDIIFSEIYPISTTTGEEEYEMQGENILTNGVKTKPDGSPLVDRFGNDIVRPVPLGWEEGDERQYYSEDHDYIAIRTVDFTQTLKVADEEVEVNPYPAESVYIHSFDVTYDGTLIEDGDTVEITADELVTFNISNVKPADTAKLDFDTLGIYLKTSAGEIELTYTGQNAYHTVGNFNRENNTVNIRAQYSGELTIILRPRGGKCEREIKLDVKPGNPSELTAETYLYSDAGGVETYSWTKHDYENEGDIVTLYEGQSLYVRALPLASEADYVDGRFVTAVPSVFAKYFDIEDNLTLEDGTVVSKITAKAVTEEDDPDVYVNLNSVITRPSTSRPGQTEPVAYARVRIMVVAAPDTSEMFTGTYKGRFSRIRMTQSGNLVPADVTATFAPDASGAAGTINISVSDGSTTVSCVYNFVYEEATRTLNCTWASGKENTETFDFDIKFNGAYKISITHPTFITEEKIRTETIVLSKQSN